MIRICVRLHRYPRVTLCVSIELADRTSDVRTMSESPEKRQNGDPWKVSQCAYSEQSLTMYASLEAIFSLRWYFGGEEATLVWWTEVGKSEVEEWRDEAGDLRDGGRYMTTRLHRFLCMSRGRPQLQTEGLRYRSPIEPEVQQG